MNRRGFLGRLLMATGGFVVAPKLEAIKPTSTKTNADILAIMADEIDRMVKKMMLEFNKYCFSNGPFYPEIGPGQRVPYEGITFGSKSKPSP